MQEELSACQQIYEDLLQAVDGQLVSEGFARRGRTFQKVLREAGVRWVIEFQKSRHSDRTQIEFTFTISAESKRRPAFYDDWMKKQSWYSHAGGRIGEFMPKKEDTWWSIDEQTDPSLLITEIVGIIVMCGLPFLRQFETDQDLQSYTRGCEADRNMKLNYPLAVELLGLDLLQKRSREEIEKRIGTVRRLGKINGVHASVTEATLKRILGE